MIDAVLISNDGSKVGSIKIESITEKVYMPEDHSPESETVKMAKYKLIGVVETKVQTPFYIREKDEENGN